MTRLALPANVMCLRVSAGYLRTLPPLGLMWVYRHILLPVPSYSGLPSPPFGRPVTMGWVGGFSNPVKHSHHECLSQNVKVMTYVAMLALMCVCVVCIMSLHILVCMCAMFDSLPNKVPP